MHQCCVHGCRSKGNHSFPKENNVRKLWEAAIRKEFRAKKTSKLCSAHFKSEDFLKIGKFSGLSNTRRILKKGIVPSIFPWTKTEDTPSKQRRDSASMRDAKRKLPFSNIEKCDGITPIPNVTTAICNISSETTALDFSVDSVEEIVTQKNLIQRVDNVEMKNEPTMREESWSSLLLANGMCIKGEPRLDGEWPESCDNVNLGYTDVCKQELSDDCPGNVDRTLVVMKVEKLEDFSYESEHFNQHCPEASSRRSSSRNLTPGTLLAEERIKVEHQSISTPADAFTYVEPYYCDICNEEFATEVDLCIHMRSHMSHYECQSRDKALIKCDINDSLEQYLSTQTGEKLPYSCLRCDYKCMVLGSLKLHMKTHPDARPYFRPFLLKTDKKTHTGDKPYSCNVCDFQCKLSDTLEKHTRKHIGEKLYSCTHCEYRSSVSSHIRIHMRTHTGEKPYSCKQCDYKTAMSWNLKVHTRTHTGEKPYSCDRCDYKCSTTSAIKIHRRKHTKKKILINKIIKKKKGVCAIHTR